MHDPRPPSLLRPIRMETDAAPNAEGSCLVSFGNTRVLCAVSVDESLPPWKRGESSGWVTGEYAMLPRSTHTRTSRERNGAKGRTQEIQRLIGRALRSVVDLELLGPRTLLVDCDVLQADGGTRTASVTGGCVALAMACSHLLRAGSLTRHPMTGLVAAVSVGLVDGLPQLDLDYAQDVRAQVDLNVVAVEGGGLVEVQGTAEGDPFPRSDLDVLLDLALGGIATLHRLQREALGEFGP